MNYAIEQRLRLIDFLLAHYGAVGRDELVDYFGISGAQVTRDFRAYIQLAPGNMVINNVSKRWVRSDTFKRVYE